MRAIRRTAPVLLAALAMLVRLVVAVLPLAAEPADAARADAAAFVALMGGTLCHADAGLPGDPADQDRGGHAHDCTLCQACLGFVAVKLAAPAGLPAAPAQVAVIRFVLPAAGAGPPPSPFATARPRGPPVTV
jgi:hypothetical protein